MVFVRSNVEITYHPEPRYYPSYEVGTLPNRPYSLLAGFDQVKLAYTPKTKITEEVMQRVASLLTNRSSEQKISGEHLLVFYLSSWHGYS